MTLEVNTALKVNPKGNCPFCLPFMQMKLKQTKKRQINEKSKKKGNSMNMLNKGLQDDVELHEVWAWLWNLSLLKYVGHLIASDMI